MSQYQEIQEKARAVTQLLRPKVVCLDDDPVTQKLYGLVLQEEADLVSAYEPGEAFALLGEREADLFVTDSVGLPYLSRLVAEFPQLPVVVLSGHAPPHELPEGVLVWHQKPLPPEGLLSLIRDHARGALD